MDDNGQAVVGLFNTLINTASAEELQALLRQLHKFMTKTLPGLVTEANIFNSSAANKVQCMQVLYKRGMISKVKYEAIHHSLYKQDELSSADATSTPAKDAVLQATDGCSQARGRLGVAAFPLSW